MNMASLVTKYAGRSVPFNPEPIPVFIMITLLLTSCASTIGINVVYLSSHCGSVVPTGVGGLLEPDVGLYYRENMDCTVTLAALPTHRILFQFHRFVLESGVNGKCLDSLRFFDGNTMNDLPLTPELCGRLPQLPDFISSGSNVTLRFKTDEGGQSFGFGIYFTQISNAPCPGDEFECNNSYCIDQSLTCNTINMCGDWSDEGNCIAPPPEPKGLSTLAMVGIGVSIIFVTTVIIMMCTKIAQDYRKRQTMERMVAKVDRDIKKNPYSSLTTDDQKDGVNTDSKADDIGLSGKVFGRKRSSKVAPLDDS